MNLSTPALITLGLVGGLLAFSGGGTGRNRPPRSTPPPGSPDPTSPPVTPPTGSSGDPDVRYLQQVLNAIRNKYALVTFAPLTEDGLLGSLTEGAVDDVLHTVWETLRSAGIAESTRSSIFHNIPGVDLGSLAIWSEYGADAEVTDARRLADWFQTQVLTDSGSLLS